MIDAVAAAAIRAFATERKYHQATIERWLQLTPTDATALFELARELRLGEHQLGDLWDWAEEIGARDGLPLARVLAVEAMVAARRHGLSRNDTLRRVKEALRRLRFPQLAALEDRLAALIRTLALPRNMRVSLPEFLEGDEVRVEITADSAAALRAAAARLLDATNSSACEDLFALLGEAP
jgi:hypothetical protein